MKLKRKLLPSPLQVDGKRLVQELDEYNYPTKSVFVPFIAQINSYQPIKSSEQLLLPEGFRTRKGFKVFSQTELRCVEEGKEQYADKLFIENEWYDVIVVDKWDVGVQPHYEALITREELR